MIDTNYIQEENILYMDRKGEIKMQELFAQVQVTVSNYKDLKCLYILDDARESIPQFSSRDYPELSKKISDGLSHFLEVRHAILVDSAMNTALGILFEGMANEIQSYSFKTFFSEEDAKNWLKDGVHYCG
ncbi:MAG: hypothetical protein DRI70_08035 [Bacteroidetes bacterium]|nr:MAG: hypothetical protein DRI70_08035 [Bacteroidota bacterium]